MFAHMGKLLESFNIDEEKYEKLRLIAINMPKIE